MVYKKCSQCGSFYAASSNSCPYCAPQQDGLKTTVSGPAPIAADTEGNRTAVVKPSGSPDAGAPAGRVAPGSSTMIIRPGDANQPKSGEPNSAQLRKLVGWLVTYTWMAQGTDFRLYEGKNLIGRGDRADIQLSEDSSVSTEHAVILYKDDKFHLQDQGASNVILINETKVQLNEWVLVEDGATLQIGQTKLIFRRVVKP